MQRVDGAYVNNAYVDEARQENANSCGNVPIERSASESLNRLARNPFLNKKKTPRRNAADYYPLARNVTRSAVVTIATQKRFVSAIEKQTLQNVNV